MTRETLLFSILVGLAHVAAGGQAVLLPAGTPLPVSIPTHLPMKLGEPIRAELLYPVFDANKLVVPAHTVVLGRIVALAPNPSRRAQARLRLDFTPYRTPVVRFDSIVAPDGTSTPIVTTDATDGAPIYRVVRTPTPQGGIIGQYFRIFLGYVDNGIQTVLAPHKADRFVQFVYSQLPWHPQRIPGGTAWTVETAAPLSFSPLPAPPPAPAPKPRRIQLLRTHPLPPDAPAKAADDKPTWIIQAYLNDAISSEFSSASQTIHATVAEPVLNPDGSVAVPTGAVLTGIVSQARPSRHFDRPGVLRFNFSELKLPDEPSQRVRTSLAAADSSTSGELDMNSEGEVQPKPRDKIIVPLFLVLLASRPAHEEGHRGAAEQAGKDGAASSGLGLISLIVGTAAQQTNAAIGIGAYSAALSIYPRFFGKGPRVAFPKDTRIVIQTTATRASSLKPDRKQP
jgi:hypothetical protein